MTILTMQLCLHHCYTVHYAVLLLVHAHPPATVCSKMASSAQADVTCQIEGMNATHDRLDGTTMSVYSKTAKGTGKTGPLFFIFFCFLFLSLSLLVTRTTESLLRTLPLQLPAYTLQSSLSLSRRVFLTVQCSLFFWHKPFRSFCSFPVLVSVIRGHKKYEYVMSDWH